MNNQKPRDGVVLATVWSILSAVLFLYFVTSDRVLGAFLIAVSGVAALPSLKAVWSRYGADNTRRRNIGMGSFVLAVVVIVASSVTEDQEEAVAVADASAVEDEPTDDNEVPLVNAAMEAARDGTVPTLSNINGCRAIDGDTLKCGTETVRLLGIDAPELEGHCAEGRECVAGDPIASQQNLQFATRYVMQIERVGRDRYDRTLAMVYVDGESLSCGQLRAGHADYIPDWDDGERLVSSCTLNAG